MKKVASPGLVFSALRYRGLSNVNLWGLTAVALLLAEILNVVQVFIPSPCCYCLLLLLLLFSGQQAENGKKPG